MHKCRRLSEKNVAWYSRFNVRGNDAQHFHSVYHECYQYFIPIPCFFWISNIHSYESIRNYYHWQQIYIKLWYKLCRMTRGVGKLKSESECRRLYECVCVCVYGVLWRIPRPRQHNRNKFQFSLIRKLIGCGHEIISRD